MIVVLIQNGPQISGLDLVSFKKPLRQNKKAATILSITSD